MWQACSQIALDGDYGTFPIPIEKSYQCVVDWRFGDPIVTAIRRAVDIKWLAIVKPWAVPATDSDIAA